MSRYQDNVARAEQRLRERQAAVDRDRELYYAEARGASGAQLLVRDFGETDDQLEPLDCLASEPIAVGATVLVAQLGSGRRVVVGPVWPAGVGQVYENGKSQGAADATSTTFVDPTFADAITLTWNAIPDGTYDLVVTFSFLAAHSTGGGVSFRSRVGATSVGGHTITVDSGAVGTLRVENVETYSNVVVAGGVTIKGQYACGTGGTSYAKNPLLRITAIRRQ